MNMPVIILTALTMAYRHALMPGFLPLSLSTTRGEIPATALRIVTRWSACFLTAIMVGAVLLRFAGPFPFFRFNHLEYLLLLFLSIVHLLNLSAKHERFRNFVYNKKWIYSIGMLQGFGALGNLVAFYAMSSEITLPILLMAALIYGLTFTAITSVIAMVLGLISHAAPKICSVSVIILSLLCLVAGILHFFFNI